MSSAQSVESLTLFILSAGVIVETLESWECHRERSKGSSHAHEQKLRGTCGQCLREALGD